MEQQIHVNKTPAQVSVNYEDLQAALNAELEKYQGMVVTQEGIADAKKAATEINKTAENIDAKRKAAVKEVSAPIRAFEDQMKTLHGMCKDTRQSILDQVAKFEDEVREQARQMLDEYRERLWAENGVDEDCRSAQYDDLAIVSNVTKSGNLAKAARETLEQRVQDDVALKDRIETRLNNLPKLSEQHELPAPITRAHVDAFLFADDAEYQERLNALIDAEKKRAQAAKEKADEQAAKAAVQARQEAESQAEQRFQERQPVETQEQPHHKAEPAPPGKDVFRVTLTFDVTVPEDKGVTSDQVKAKVLGKLGSAGVPAPDNVTIQEMQGKQERITA